MALFWTKSRQESRIGCRPLWVCSCPVWASSMRRLRAMQLGAVLALAFAAVAVACAHPVTMPAKVLRVVDGDTIEVSAALWLQVGDRSRQMRSPVLVRVVGVDTPELKAAKECERERARLALDFARAWVGAEVEIEVLQLDKYSGRVDAHVTRGGKSLADALIAAGLGRPYGGDRRGPWC